MSVERASDIRNTVMIIKNCYLTKSISIKVYSRRSPGLSTNSKNWKGLSWSVRVNFNRYWIRNIFWQVKFSYALIYFLIFKYTFLYSRNCLVTFAFHHKFSYLFFVMRGKVLLLRLWVEWLCLKFSHVTRIKSVKKRISEEFRLWTVGDR